MSTVCWLFMRDPTIAPFAYGTFNGHTHDSAFVSDGEGPGLFVVECATCHVSNAEHGLVYDMAVEPKNEAGVESVPLGAAAPVSEIN